MGTGTLLSLDHKAPRACDYDSDSDSVAGEIQPPSPNISQHPIVYFYDNIISLQRAESFRILLSFADYGFCF